MSLKGLQLPIEIRRLRAMLLIRKFEERLYQEYCSPRVLPGGRFETMKIGGFLHLSSGQEAIAVGIAEAFRRETDTLVAGVRSLGQVLALGASPRRVMAELFGRATGCCGGRAGSVGLIDRSVGFLGAFHVAGSQAPVGIGAAFASHYRRDSGCAFIVFGDGALNQGAVHEALNLASLHKLPAIFVLENNGVACGTKVERHSADPDLLQRGRGFGMPCRGFDGNDIEQVAANVGEAVNRARSGGGPTYLVANTFRFRGFTMSDPLKYRSREEMDAARQRDPIRLLSHRLYERGLLTEQLADELVKEANAIAEDAARFAEESPDPAE